MTARHDTCHDTLGRICADKRAHVARQKAAVSFRDVRAKAEEMPPPRGFLAALQKSRQDGRYGLIAEIKKASPSRGVIRADFDPAAIARIYEAAGASCLSVLTDTPWFQGEDAHLAAARAPVTLPVLRKDFMLDPYQIFEARALGADCVLLILAALDDATARDLEACAEETGMDVLAEVHDQAELERALAILKTPLIGINNRNLKTLAVDIRTALELAPGIPAGKTIVGESGLKTPEDLSRLAAAGIGCFLIGESFMAAEDIGGAVRKLLTQTAN